MFLYMALWMDNFRADAEIFKLYILKYNSLDKNTDGLLILWSSYAPKCLKIKVYRQEGMEQNQKEKVLKIKGQFYDFQRYLFLKRNQTKFCILGYNILKILLIQSISIF